MNELPPKDSIHSMSNPSDSVNPSRLSFCWGSYNQFEYYTQYQHIQTGDEEKRIHSISQAQCYTKSLMSLLNTLHSEFLRFHDAIGNKIDLSYCCKQYLLAIQKHIQETIFSMKDYGEEDSILYNCLTSILKHYELFIVFYLSTYRNDYEFQKAIISFFQNYIIPIKHLETIEKAINHSELCDLCSYLEYCQELLLHGNIPELIKLLNLLDTNGISIPDKETLLSLLSTCPYYQSSSEFVITSSSLQKWRENCKNTYEEMKNKKSELLSLFSILAGNLPSTSWEETLLLQILYNDDLIEYDQILTTIEQHDESLYFEIKNPCYILSNLIEIGLSPFILYLTEVFFLLKNMNFSFSSQQTSKHRIYQSVVYDFIQDCISNEVSLIIPVETLLLLSKTISIPLNLPNLLSSLFSSQAIGTGNDICRLLSLVPIIPDSSLQASITWDLLTSSIHHFLMKENVYQAVRWERELILQFDLKEYHSECIEYCLSCFTHDLPIIVRQSYQVVSMLMDVREAVENYCLLSSLLPVLSYFINDSSINQSQEEWNELFTKALVTVNQSKDNVKWSLMAMICKVVLSCCSQNQEKLQFLSMKNLLAVNTCFQKLVVGKTTKKYIGNDELIAEYNEMLLSFIHSHITVYSVFNNKQLI